MAKPVYEKLFEAQNPGFVEALRAEHDSAALAKFVGRWTADGRAGRTSRCFAIWILPGIGRGISR